MNKNINKTNKILLVDDDDDTLYFLNELLTSKGYEIILAKSGAEAIQKISSSLPHLVITDLIMPGINGSDLVTKIRNDAIMSHIPIMVLTGKNDLKTEIENLNYGIDDFIKKPFNSEELLAKIHCILYRTYRGLDANPLTKLPGNNAIREKIEEVIHNNKPYAVCYLDLDNFKAFNDKYGFERGDEVINLTASIIIESIKKFGKGNEFVGHIGGDDFVIIINPLSISEICENIIKQFDMHILSMYDEEDRANKYIISQNRQGKKETFSIMTISIGVVTNENKKLIHSVQVSEIAGELKKFAKSFKQSNYVIDERKNDNTLIMPITKKTIMNVEFKNFSSIMSDVQNFLKKRQYVGMLYININSHDDKQKKICKETLDMTHKIFFESPGNLLRNSDEIYIYNDERDKLFIYLSSARNKINIKSDDMENVIQRIEKYFNSDQIIKDRSCKVNIVLGYALVIFPSAQCTV